MTVEAQTYRGGTQDKGVGYEDAVKAALEESGTITVKGTYSTPSEAQSGKKYRGATVGSSTGYSYAAQVVELSVDEGTGEITVEKVWVAHD